MINFAARMKQVAYIIIVLCVFLACGGNRQQEDTLMRARAVMNEHPDSAIAILDSLYCNEAERNHGVGSTDHFKSSRSKSETGGHEIGHTLGMTHNESGLMTADSSNKKRSKEFNQRDINDMIRYPLNHDRNSDAGKGFLK